MEAVIVVDAGSSAELLYRAIVKHPRTDVASHKSMSPGVVAANGCAVCWQVVARIYAADETGHRVKPKFNV